MRRRQEQPEVKPHQSTHKDDMPADVGGREFGNVIEPTQAQMASDNKGLTAERDQQSPDQKRMEKQPGKRRKKAA